MRPYRPHPGSIAARAIAVLTKGPMRQTGLADHLGVDRRSLYMSLLTAVEKGVVISRREPAPPGEGPIAAIYELVGWDDDMEFEPDVRLVAGPGELPPLSREAIAAANPFGCRA